MKQIAMALLVSLSITNVYAKSSAHNGNDIAMPCERKISLQKITRAVIPMTAFRGVNLIFPYNLPDSTTTYTPSANTIWDYKSAKGQKIVSLYFKTFKPDLYGEIQDFTISTPDNIVTLGLKADPNMAHHCTDIVFTMSEAEKKRIEAARKKNYQAQMDAEYKKKFDNLEKHAEDLALDFVGSLTNDRPDTTKIYQQGSLKNAKGDTITLYVDEAKKFGKFSILGFEVKNDSAMLPLYINSVSVGKITNKNRTPITGHADYNQKLSMNSAKNFQFTTLDNIPETNGYMVIDTNEGKLETTW